MNKVGTNFKHTSYTNYTSQNMDEAPDCKVIFKNYLPGLSSVDVAKNYSECATTYDQNLNSNLYRGPEIAAQKLADSISEEQRRNVKIIDVAAGTGRVGVILKEYGFTNIDALEPSEGMMDMLLKTGVYSKTYLEFLGLGQNSIPDDSYDAVVIAGGMGQGHIPVEGIDDMIRITKPGGIVINVMRKEYLYTAEMYRGKLLPYINQLEQEGKWSKISVETIPNYCFNKEGIIFTYKVL